MSVKGKTMTVSARADEYKSEGMYVFDRTRRIMMCKICNSRVSWERKSVVDLHCKSQHHLNNKEKAASEASRKRQSSLSGSFEHAKKVKTDRERFIKSTVHAFVKANIPLHKLDHPEMRAWLKQYFPDSGDLPDARWLRAHYLPLIKADYDEELQKLLNGRKIVVLTDETTNRKGEAALIILFLVLPDVNNPEPCLVVAAVKTLIECTGDQTSKALLQTFVEHNVLHNDVVALVSDSAAYMTLCTKLLRDLGLTNLIHIQCWAHKLDKITKVFSEKLVRLNECVAKTKKLFKNTRKRKHRYMRFLKDKYSFSKAKEAKLFPLPVMTRWGSWLVSVQYLSEYVEDIVSYAKKIPESDSVLAVEFFKKLSTEDNQIIKAEAVFTAEYCTPVCSLLTKLEASKAAQSHLLYSHISDVKKVFNLLKSAGDIKSVLNNKTKSSLETLSSGKKKNLELRIQSVCKKCDGIFCEYLSGDTGNTFFKASQQIFSPSKIVTEVPRHKLLEAKKKLPMLSSIPDYQFIVLHALLTDSVKEICAAKSSKDDPVFTALMGMRINHPVFVQHCLQVLYVPVTNVDCERGFSAYTDILSPRRTRLKTKNTEVMMCLYFGDDPNYNILDTDVAVDVNFNDEDPDNPEAV